jgi:hypothetical protein
MEVFTINADGSAHEAYSLPLVPVLPQEEIEAFFVTVEQLRYWAGELAAFASAHGLLQ